MPTDPNTESGPYADAREAFGRLDSGEQAAFAFEALLSAGGTLVQEAGKEAASVIRGVERAFADAFRHDPKTGPEGAEGAGPAADPETPSR